MVVRNPRDPWRLAWQIASSRHLLSALLLATAVGLTMAGYIPQISADDPVRYARRLSEAQARFAGATPLLRSLGLFSITGSPGFRALLALLSGCLLIRLVDAADLLRRHRAPAEPAAQWQDIEAVNLVETARSLRRRGYRNLGQAPRLQVDRWPWAHVFVLLSCMGALSLLGGLLLNDLWGWQRADVVIQGTEPVPLADGGKWVALGEDGRTVAHSPGMRTAITERGPGAEINAAGTGGRLLSLQQTAEGPAVTQLTVALAETLYSTAREALIAIPDARLVVRLLPQAESDIAPDAPVLIQVYSSPSGELLAERVMTEELDLSVSGVDLRMGSVPYTQLNAVFNPGFWPCGIGLVLLMVGLLGHVVLRPRRFWLRGGGSGAQGAGDLPVGMAQCEGR